MADIIEALERLILLLFNKLGTWVTVALAVVVTLGFFLRRIYLDKRKDRYVDKLLEEKDRTIQRLAEMERNYRILFLKEKGWSDDDIERFVMKNTFSNEEEARNELEEDGD